MFLVLGRCQVGNSFYVVSDHKKGGNLSLSRCGLCKVRCFFFVLDLHIQTFQRICYLYKQNYFLRWLSQKWLSLVQMGSAWKKTDSYEQFSIVTNREGDTGKAWRLVACAWSQALKAHSNNFCPLSPNSKSFSLIEKNDKGVAEVCVLAAIST